MTNLNSTLSSQQFPILPSDTLNEIFLFLTPPELKSCACTCKLFKSLADVFLNDEKYIKAKLEALKTRVSQLYFKNGLLMNNADLVSLKNEASELQKNNNLKGIYSNYVRQEYILNIAKLQEQINQILAKNKLEFFKAKGLKEESNPFYDSWSVICFNISQFFIKKIVSQTVIFQSASLPNASNDLEQQILNLERKKSLFSKIFSLTEEMNTHYKTQTNDFNKQNQQVLQLLKEKISFSVIKNVSMLSNKINITNIFF